MFRCFATVPSGPLAASPAVLPLAQKLLKHILDAKAKSRQRQVS